MAVRGFIYYVSITGITGTRSTTAEHLARSDSAHPQGVRSADRRRLRRALAGAGSRSGARRRCGGGGLGAVQHDRGEPGQAGSRAARCSIRCANSPPACAARGCTHELAHRIRPPEDPHAVRAARGAGEPLAPMPGLPADDLPSRPDREPEGLSALRAPHARRRHRAPRLHLRRRQLHAHRVAEGDGRSAALPRHQALHRPAEGGARQDAPRRCAGGRAWQDRRPPGRRRGDGIRVHRRLDGRRGRRRHSSRRRGWPCCRMHR